MKIYLCFKGDRHSHTDFVLPFRLLGHMVTSHRKQAVAQLPGMLPALGPGNLGAAAAIPWDARPTRLLGFFSSLGSQMDPLYRRAERHINRAPRFSRGMPHAHLTGFLYTW